MSVLTRVRLRITMKDNSQQLTPLMTLEEVKKLQANMEQYGMTKDLNGEEHYFPPESFIKYEIISSPERKAK